MERVVYSRTNHVISVRLRSRRALPEFASLLMAGKYSPKKFSAITLKVINPNATVILFSTGTATVMGCTSYYAALVALRFLREKLDLEFVHIVLTNIVAKFSIFDRFEVDVDKFRAANQDCCSYNPSVFPSCSFKLPDPTKNIKVNLFSSGRIIVAGPKTREDLEHTVRVVMERFDTTFRRLE
ncbi:TATA-box-binding protein [Hondaea fermentalgiana]|uniref:TATA-box-binding protein n=1 Tax=Hondaea fermentalgiana TaxID=2315210 RepID=A0A2R5GPZ1_9STRA|nr:TATA-box-binding protein [Hondaea fermentalgiana]|eukprot:GBG32369.1 TATA-box-binding protein [Hondaea fermentalgiana]